MYQLRGELNNFALFENAQAAVDQQRGMPDPKPGKGMHASQSPITPVGRKRRFSKQQQSKLGARHALRIQGRYCQNALLLCCSRTPKDTSLQLYQDVPGHQLQCS